MLNRDQMKQFRTAAQPLMDFLAKLPGTGCHEVRVTSDAATLRAWEASVKSNPKPACTCSCARR